MKSIGYNLPGLPGLPPAAKTYARYPVWRNSTSQPIEPHALVSKREAGRLYARAMRWERRTRAPGRQDGILSRNGLAVLRALLFDLLDYRTGRLDPARQTIADRACISLSSVQRGLARLKITKVLEWVQRCWEGYNEEGQYERRQRSNWYTIRLTRQWNGFIEPEPPPVEPWQIGATPPLPDPIEDAVAAHFADAAPEDVIERYRADPNDKLALAWAGLLETLRKKGG